MKHILILLLIINPVLSYACSCAFKAPIKTAVNSSDIVVTGRVISKKKVNVDYNLGFSVPEYVYIIKIDKIYKGEFSTKRIKIRTGIGGGDCGFQFKKYKRYIIYGNETQINLKRNPNLKDIKWVTDICTRTQFFDKSEILELNKLSKGTSWNG